LKREILNKMKGTKSFKRKRINTSTSGSYEQHQLKKEKRVPKATEKYPRGTYTVIHSIRARKSADPYSKETRQLLKDSRINLIEVQHFENEKCVRGQTEEGDWITIEHVVYDGAVDLNVKLVQGESSYSSIYRGVFWDTTTEKWKAQLYHKKQQFYLGLFTDELKAAMAVNWKCNQFGIKLANANTPARAPLIGISKKSSQQSKTKDEAKESDDQISTSGSSQQDETMDEGKKDNDQNSTSRVCEYCAEMSSLNFLLYSKLSTLKVCNACYRYEKKHGELIPKSRRANAKPFSNICGYCNRLNCGKYLIKRKVYELKLCAVCYQFETTHGKLIPLNERAHSKPLSGVIC